MLTKDQEIIRRHQIRMQLRKALEAVTSKAEEDWEVETCDIICELSLMQAKYCSYRTSLATQKMFGLKEPDNKPDENRPD